MNDICTLEFDNKLHKECINNAKEFLKNEKAISNIYYIPRFHCIITDDYNSCIKKFVENGDTSDVNGRYIPRKDLKAKCGIDKDLIIINYKKVLKAQQETNNIKIHLTSVIIHEVTHLIDFVNYDEFKTTFDDFFKDENISDELKAEFEKRFWYYSEMRAKYFQDKYFLNQISLSEQKQWIEKTATKISKDYVYYGIAHLWGQLKLWNDFKHLGIYELIEKNTKVLNEFKESDQFADFSDFSFEDFLKKCKSTLQNEQRFNMEKDFLLDRTTYKKIKAFDRKQMENFIKDIYANGAENNNAVQLDMSKLRNEIGAIKGVGESRLNEIMAVIEKNLSSEE